MGVFAATGQGFRGAFKLPVAIFLFVGVFSAVGALATVLLPYEIVNGQTHVPPPTTPGEAASLLVLSLGLYLPTMLFSLWLLGGIVGVCPKLLGGEPVSAGDLFGQARRSLFPMIKWGAAIIVVLVAAGVVSAFLFSFLWAITGRSPAMKPLIGVGFWSAILAAGLLLMYSPVILVEKGTTLQGCFGESKRFFYGHRASSFGLLLWVAFIGAMVYLAWVFGVAPAVAKLRALLGFAPYAKGLPVFLFGLLLGLPAAFLSVFFPITLTAFYRGR